MKRTIAILLMVFVCWCCLGSQCTTQSTLDTIRQVHIGVREAGHLADEEIAPRFENKHETCIAEAEEAGYPAGSGQEGMNFWTECMEKWLRLDVAVSAFRNSLEELENVYNDVEAGTRGESDWQYWAGRVLDHGRTVLRLVRELEIEGIPDNILEGLQTGLEAICGLLQCNEEASP